MRLNKYSRHIVTVNGKAAFQDLCKALKLKLWQPKDITKQQYELTEIVKKSKFQRTQYLTIIENWKSFLAILKAHEVVDRRKKVQSTT